VNGGGGDVGGDGGGGGSRTLFYPISEMGFQFRKTNTNRKLFEKYIIYA